MIAVEARESIPLSKITLSIIKCIHEFNLFGIRSVLINNNEIKESYPQYTGDETWEYIMKCIIITAYRKDFITDLAKELLAVQ